MKERKIALVGTSGTGNRAPYEDPSWEIWGVSARADYVTRADRWFELHRLDGEPKEWADLWRENLAKQIEDVDALYMIWPEPLHKSVVRYPVDHILARFGTFNMTSTFSWMMALAIDELRPEGKKPIPGQIAIFGVEMEYGTEYRQQRSGFRHFIDLAHFAGIPVSRLADGGLAMEPIPYPMWQDDPLLNKLNARKADALRDLNEWDENRQRTKRIAIENFAALAEIERMADKAYDSEKRRIELRKELTGLEQTIDQLDRDIATRRGQFEEECFILDYLQP